MHKIFILDDDPQFCKLVEYSLKDEPDLEITKYTSGVKMLTDLHFKPKILILDYTLGDMNGMEVFRQVKNFSSEIFVIMISGQSNVDIAINVLRSGVRDYIVKNEDWQNRLLLAVRSILGTIALKTEVEELKEQLEHKYHFENIIGNSEGMQKVFNLIQKALMTNITVCITGASGTGKELVAKAIHYNSTRKKKPLVSLNMGAIPKDLIESELFGHEKGAFTGANARRIGKFEEATGGSLFLDEITELDISMQVKLLRVLQEQEITRVGGSGVISIDTRVIVASNKNLENEIRGNRFREDLFYRIYGFPITLPTLKERGEDIIILANHFIKEFCKINELERKEFTPDSLRFLMSYSWPGNVRELRSVTERACILSEGRQIRKEHILFTNINTNPLSELDNMTLEEMKMAIIQKNLIRFSNDIDKVASHLKIGRSTIYRLLKESQIKS